MKKKLQKPRLSLNKRTIANLNKQNMDSIVGGDDGGNDSNGLYDTNPCDIILSMADPLLCEEKKAPESNGNNPCPEKPITK